MKTNQKKVFRAVSVALVLFSSWACTEEEFLQPPDRFFPDARGNFDAFWAGMNSSYLFWDMDTTRWDEAYFYREAITDTTDDSTLFGLFTEMTSGVLDGHYSIEATLGDTTFQWSPAVERVRASGGTEHLPLVLEADAYARQMLSGYDTLVEDIGFYGMIRGTNIQYFRLATFAFTGSGAVDRPGLLKAMNFIQNPPANTQGMIVDLRTNGGGDASDISTFVSLFLPKDTKIGSIRSRKAANRFSYGPWRDFILAGTAKPYTKPVVVLVDRFSISMAEITTLALALRPNTTVVGERTFGAQGPRLDEPVDLTLGGTFTLPNGWLVTMADQAVRYIDGKVYEGIGFPPDVEVKFDLARYRATGRDNQLDAAIGLFR